MPMIYRALSCAHSEGSVSLLKPGVLDDTSGSQKVKEKHTKIYETLFTD